MSNRKIEATICVADVYADLGAQVGKGEFEASVNQELKRRFELCGIKFIDKDGLYPVGHHRVHKEKSYKELPVITITQWTD